MSWVYLTQPAHEAPAGGGAGDPAALVVAGQGVEVGTRVEVAPPPGQTDRAGAHHSEETNRHFDGALGGFDPDPLALGKFLPGGVIRMDVDHAVRTVLEERRNSAELRIGEADITAAADPQDRVILAVIGKTDRVVTKSILKRNS